ncbi:unnamed protein product [Sphagnum balticum]
MVRPTPGTPFFTVIDACALFLLGAPVLNITHLDERTSIVRLPFEDKYDTTWIKVVHFCAMIYAVQVQLGIDYVHRTYRGRSNPISYGGAF